MIPIPIECIIIILTMYITNCFHEAGHYLAARCTSAESAKIGFKEQYGIPTPMFVEISGDTSELEGLFIVISGIIIGLIPFVCLYYLSDELYCGIVLICILDYFVFGCRFDIRDVYRIVKG